MATILEKMGNTPLIKIHPDRWLPGSFADIYVKLEMFNPGGSIKSRVALNMVDEAEKAGVLTPGSGQTIIEPTGGNTGVGLAMVGSVRGYKVVLVVPDDYVSPTRLKLLEMQGAEVILTDHTTGNDSHIKKVESLVASNREFVWLDQFTNRANPNAHYFGTGTEIQKVLPTVDAFVAGIGSGGTISGVGRRLRESNPNIRLIGVQPENCDVLTGIAVPHCIQGFAVGMIPDTLDGSLVSEVRSIGYGRVLQTLREIARWTGVFVGISAAANISIAIEVAREMGPGNVIATIACDGGRNYIDRLGELTGELS